MRTYILILGLFLFSKGCEKIDTSSPVCIKEKINEFCHGEACDDASVGQYIFQNEFVYVFSEGTCGADRGAQVYNESCESIGYLGGFFANTKIQGINFYEEAVFQKMIWKK